MSEDWLKTLAPYNVIDRGLIMGEFPAKQLPEGAEFSVNLDTVPHNVGTVRLHFPFEDGPTVPAFHRLYAVAHTVNTWREHDQSVYVHCRAGLNRSGLICALVLMQRGYSASSAIMLLRQKRDSAVLCNNAFERWLLNLNVS